MDLERKLDKISFHFSRTGKIYDDCLVVYFAFCDSRILRAVK